MNYTFTDLSEFKGLRVLGVGGSNVYGLILPGNANDNYKIKVSNKPRKIPLFGGLIIQSYFVRRHEFPIELDKKSVEAYEISIPTFKLNHKKFDELTQILKRRNAIRNTTHSIYPNDGEFIPKKTYDKYLKEMKTIEERLENEFKYSVFLKIEENSGQKFPMFNFFHLRSKRDYIKWYDVIRLEFEYRVSQIQSNAAPLSKNFIYHYAKSFYEDKYSEASEDNIHAPNKWALNETIKRYPELSKAYLVKILPSRSVFTRKKSKLNTIKNS